MEKHPILFLFAALVAGCTSPTRSAPPPLQQPISATIADRLVNAAERRANLEVGAILAGALLDLANGHPNASRLLMDQLESLVMGLGIVATFSAVGIFFGVLADSIIVGVILILFAGGFVTFLPALPPLLGLPNSALWSLLLGAATTAVVMALASLAFNKKQF